MASKKKAKKAKKALKSFKKSSNSSKKTIQKKRVSKTSKKPIKHNKHKKHSKQVNPKTTKTAGKIPVAERIKPVAKSHISEPPKPVKPTSDDSVESYVNNMVLKIKNIELQGANDIAEGGVRALRYVAEKSTATNRKAFLEELCGAADRLKEARPTEPALRNTINSIVNCTDRYELKGMDNVRKYAIRQADRFLKELSEVIETISKIGSEEIRDNDVIVTHCHSEHVVELLKAAKEKRKQFRVIVTETRPLMQGLITAKELSEAGIDTTYIIDSAVATVMKQSTKMIVGADAILADGSIVNKIGTYAMALLAQQFQTPVYVAAETLKFDPVTIMGAAEPIEERSPEEITDPQEIKRVHIKNPAFDVTPAELIDALITEKGIMRPGLLRENVENIL